MSPIAVTSTPEGRADFWATYAANFDRISDANLELAKSQPELGSGYLASAREEPPRAVILDLLMPGIDGFELLRRFRAETHTADVPVMIWTVRDRTLDEHRQLMSGAQGVLAKGGRSETAALIAQLSTLLPPPLRPPPGSSTDGE